MGFLIFFNVNLHTFEFVLGIFVATEVYYFILFVIYYNYNNFDLLINLWFL
jgi:hypothetical protein